MTDILPASNAPAPANQGTPNPASPVSASPAPAGEEAPAWFKQYSEQNERRLTELDRTFKTAQGQARQTENEFRKQLAILNQYKSQGLSDEEALSEMEADQSAASWRKSVDERFEKLVSLLERGGTQTSDNGAVAKVFESLGLDLKDTRVASALLRKYESPDQVELAAYRLQRELAQSPNPNPAQNASMNNGNQTTANNPQALIDEIAKLQRNPVENRDRIREIKKELGWK